MLVFVGIGRDDTTSEVEAMPGKILRAKLWEDEKGEKKVKVTCSIRLFRSSY